ncbi:MAG: hypothetical protein FD124_2237 [Alphaproteobacteria bacterium]|nr:MAG: hypothetical protein FD160_1586 [Caulobacteraceae bacterium]TPW05267.1 MAG: hypothetical protein FD124_2237 [Alphaproteobacteria bacterium]
MRAILGTLFLLAACSERPVHEFPSETRARFAEACPTGEPECDCMWDEITREMTPEEFDAAMTRFDEKGLMDPRLTQTRHDCRGKK